MRLSRALILFVFAALLAVGLIACGGGGGNDEDPQKVLDETFQPGKDYSSGVVDLDFKLSAAGSQPGTLDATVKGPFQSQEAGFPSFDLTADVKVDGGGQSFSFAGGLTSTGDGAFVNFQNADYEVDPSTFNSFKQLFLNLQAQNKNQQQGNSINPSQFLTDLSNEGTEDVEGTETVLVTGTADVNKLIDSVKNLSGSSALPGGQDLEQLRDSVESSKFDVYSSTDDHRLQKLTTHLVFKPPPTQATSGDETVTLDFGITFSDLGQEQTISAPTNAQPLSALLQKYGIDPGGLQGALGGAGGSSGSGSGSGSGTSAAPTPPSNGATQAYLDCLSQAKGQDAVQACSSQLQ